MTRDTSRISSVGGFNVFFLLFLLPLGFSFGVHYILAKHYMFERDFEAKSKGDVEQALKKLADFQSIKPLLPLYSSDLKFNVVTKTNEIFNLTLPVIGQYEVKYIKTKEEMMRPDSQNKVVSAGYSIVAEHFEVAFMLQGHQANGSPDFTFTLRAEVFGRTQLARSIVGVLAPVFECRAKELFEAIQSKILV